MYAEDSREYQNLKKKIKLENALRTRQQRFKALDAKYIELFDPIMQAKLFDKSHLGDAVKNGMRSVVDRIYTVGQASST